MGVGGTGSSEGAGWADLVRGRGAWAVQSGGGPLGDVGGWGRLGGAAGGGGGAVGSVGVGGASFSWVSLGVRGLLGGGCA